MSGLALFAMYEVFELHFSGSYRVLLTTRAGRSVY